MTSLASSDSEADLQFRKIIAPHLLNAVRRSYGKGLHSDQALEKRITREVQKVLKFLYGSNSQQRRRGRKSKFPSQAFRAYREVELRGRPHFFNSWIEGFAQMSSEQRKRSVKNFRSAYLHWSKKSVNKLKLVVAD